MSERALSAALESRVPAATAAVCTEQRLLPPAQKEGGMPLFSALSLRHSSREYSDRALPEQLLSNLLWAAFGVNRPAGERTAPYWRHVMVIDIYAAMADGVWLYEPEKHALLRHLSHDVRAQTGEQGFAAVAPLDLIYVANGDRMSDLPFGARHLYSYVDAAFIGENVYLCCAAEGLGTVFRGAINRTKLTRALKLSRGQFVTFAQTVGYPPAST